MDILQKKYTMFYVTNNFSARYIEISKEKPFQDLKG